MQEFCLQDTDFQRVKRYANKNSIDLLVLDFNGVLDDYYCRKYKFIYNLLEAEQKHFLPDLILEIEKAYIVDRSSTIEQSVKAYFKNKNLIFGDAQKDKLASGMAHSEITPQALRFLKSLKINFVIYTSLSDDQVTASMGDLGYDLYSRDQYAELKPSSKNLIHLSELYSVDNKKVCVVGDGLVDDLMPASLIGMHTILATPYARSLIGSAKG
jgi:FMN phosphatase YigB (HAD superfamily)